jgi:hypothetical protein
MGMFNEAAARASFAKSDLAIARREREMMVCQTKEGTVAVRYDVAAKSYSITKQGFNAKLLAEGPPRVVATVLAALYVVEYA